MGLHALGRRLTGLVTSAVLLAGGLTALTVVLAPSAFADPSPAPVNASQLITVNAPSAGATTGTLTAWSRGTDGVWRVAIGPVTAYVGSGGIGKAAEGSGYTPAGTYALTQAFGREPNPGTRLPYFKTDALDWWDENPASSTYNLHVRRASSPGGDSENLYYSGSVYDYAVNMNYNMARVPGAGSAFFLHVTSGAPTAGCVAVSRGTMVSILRWLDPAKHPYIYNKIGAPWKPPTPPVLRGKVDVLAPIGGRQINVAGWAVNPAEPAARMRIAVGVSGPKGWVYSYDTTRFARPDVVRAIPGASPTSGFHLHVAGPLGTRLVCVYEITMNTGQSRQMGCHHLTFR